MRIVPIALNELTTNIISIGMQGEQNHTQVVIDAGIVFSDYPNATVSMTIQPPVGVAYPKTVEKDGTV